MDKNKQKHFEELLNGEKKEREHSLFDDRIGLHVSLRDSTSELSSYDNHPGDMGSETYEAELNQSFRLNDKYALSEIENALVKIENGNYGECEACHKGIEEDRLEIMPHARFCIHCENNFEQKIGDQENVGEAGRPIEEQVIPNLGYSFRDMTLDDETGFDGEDTWQDLNEYNVKMSDNDFSHEDSFGYVEDVDQISNVRYKNQVE